MTNLLPGSVFLAKQVGCTQGYDRLTTLRDRDVSLFEIVNHRDIPAHRYANFLSGYRTAHLQPSLCAPVLEDLLPTHLIPFHQDPYR